VVIVFAVFGAGLRIEEVVAGDEFEDLKNQYIGPAKVSCIRTIAAMLQTSVLAPHFAPNMTSGDLYCLV
jgi:hypothetical protein